MKFLKVAIFFFLTFLLGIIIISSPKAVLGKPEKNEIPEEDGDYPDPEHPGIRVRVFVHKEKPTKPEKAGRPTPPPPVLQCNLEDPDSSATVSSAGWKLQSTWTYNLNLESAPNSVGSNSLPIIAGNGFNQWALAIKNKVHFQRGNNTSISRQAYDSQNIIAWGRVSSAALGITYIRYYPDTGEVVDMDTILNKKYFWTWSNSNICAYLDTYDAENILTHELGHWVGLDDEYDTNLYQHATMYGYGAKGEVKKVTLTIGDKTGANKIYNP